jgi:hypothetical protein
MKILIKLLALGFTLLLLIGRSQWSGVEAVPTWLLGLGFLLLLDGLLMTEARSWADLGEWLRACASPQVLPFYVLLIVLFTLGTKEPSAGQVPTRIGPEPLRVSSPSGLPGPTATGVPVARRLPTQQSGAPSAVLGSKPSSVTVPPGVSKGGSPTAGAGNSTVPTRPTLPARPSSSTAVPGKAPGAVPSSSVTVPPGASKGAPATSSSPVQPRPSLPVTPPPTSSVVPGKAP